MGMKALPIFGHANLIFVNLKLDGNLGVLRGSDWQGWLHWSL